MKIKVIFVGKSENDIRGMTDKFWQRIRSMQNIEIIEITHKANRNQNTDQRKTEEGKKILAQISPNDFVILLDEKGKMFSSKEWAKDLEKKRIYLNKRLVFVVGGPYGFSDEIYKRADEKLSLSPMTFSHQLIRVIFAEQLYRVLSIIYGKPYHNE